MVFTVKLNMDKEWDISEETFTHIRDRVLRWTDLRPGTVYVYAYAYGNASSLQFATGLDSWTQANAWSVSAPRGRSSGYGDSQIYARAI